ncbi:hypothetical protein H9Q09_00925 [Aurantimonas sp. DM33-3]|uniref:hypothetical protein n=1 Tax=Aurantimonas sp. DM33-3 TaxID=2766955 RepID=UPI00165202ED|nr:hypothetical protein [Aurantimonas sp. DM33-3]MBC6714747.1 hypothetical protein [Aurantimonas sp. DM33-3]
MTSLPILNLAVALLVSALLFGIGIGVCFDPSESARTLRAVIGAALMTMGAFVYLLVYIAVI